MDPFEDLGASLRDLLRGSKGFGLGVREWGNGSL